MIVGIGIDLCDLKRMHEMLEKPRFLTRFFSAEEQRYIESRGAQMAHSAAGIFAAKEAFLKALGTGITGTQLSEISVIHNAAGAPMYHLTGGAEAMKDARGITRLHLSITHDGGVAAAVAIAEGDP